MDGEVGISQLEDKAMDLTQREQQNEKRTLKSEDTVRTSRTLSIRKTFALWGPRTRREKEPEKLFIKIVAEKFPNLGNEADIQIR